MAQRTSLEPPFKLFQHANRHRMHGSERFRADLDPDELDELRAGMDHAFEHWWAIAEASAVKNRVSKRRTRPGGVMARAIRNRPDGSGSSPASANGFHSPINLPLQFHSCVEPCGRGKARFLRRPREWPRLASARARAGAIFGLPLQSAFSRGLPGNRSAATGMRLSLASTRPPGNTNFPGMNTTLSCRLPTRTRGTLARSIHKDQRRGVFRAAVRMTVVFGTFLLLSGPFISPR
jgi:hypothetical protein